VVKHCKTMSKSEFSDVPPPLFHVISMAMFGLSISLHVMPQVPLLGQEEDDDEVPNGVPNGSNGATTSPLLISQLLPGQASEKGALLEAWPKLQ